MDLTDMLVPLELACGYCLKNPKNRRHYEVLGEVIHSIFRQAVDNGVEMGFIYRNPVFQQAWDLFCSLPSAPAAQHRSNVVYLLSLIHI